MTTERSDTHHSFDWRLACSIGVEKAILVGNFQYWITENEKRKSDDHFREGQYWTYWTGAELAKKYPYLKAPSIYRWLDQLKDDGWIQTGRFNEKQINQTTWYGRGELMIDWFKSPIYQNDNSDSQTDKSGYQNDKWDSQTDKSNSQNDKPISQNDKSIYKDTQYNTQNTAENTTHLSSSVENAPATALANSENLEAATGQKSPPVTATPPDPPPKPEKKTYGDGELQRKVNRFYRDHPEAYPFELGIVFLKYYCAIIQKSDKPADIGQERWRTYTTFDYEDKLEEWNERRLEDEKKARQTNGSATRPTQNAFTTARPTGRSSGSSAGSGKPVKRTATVRPGLFNRAGQGSRNADHDAGLRTIRIDVDPGDPPAGDQN